MVWDILLKTLSDLKDARILMWLTIPLVAGLVLVSLLGYGLIGLLFTSDWLMQSDLMGSLEQWLEQTEQDLAAIPIIGGMLLWLVTTLVTVSASLLGILIGSYLVLLFAMVIAGFLTEKLVAAVHDRHYPGLTYQGHGSTTRMIMRLLGYGAALLLLMILTLPVMLIPGINLIWFWLLGFLFFRYSMVLDVGMVILPESLFRQEKSITRWTPTLVLLVFYALSSIPLLNLFAPMLAVIALAHYFFERLTETQAASDQSASQHG